MRGEKRFCARLRLCEVGIGRRRGVAGRGKSKGGGGKEGGEGRGRRACGNGSVYDFTALGV